MDIVVNEYTHQIYPYFTDNEYLELHKNYMKLIAFGSCVDFSRDPDFEIDKVYTFPACAMVLL